MNKVFVQPEPQAITGQSKILQASFSPRSSKFLNLHTLQMLAKNAAIYKLLKVILITTQDMLPMRVERWRLPRMPEFQMPSKPM